MIRKIISGGQTGVDRAALDFAIRTGLPYGGRIPRGRAAEDGTIDAAAYPHLEEAASADPDERTRLNVEESDGTLVIAKGPPDRGTRLTLEFARDTGKPYSYVDLESADFPTAADRVRSFVSGHGIQVLNVAGPRESKVRGGIYADAMRLLGQALAGG